MRILFYYDGTQYAKYALPAVIMHAKAFHAHVDIVSSLPKGNERHLKEIESRETDLEYVKKSIEKEHISCETHLLIDGHSAGDDIIECAEKHKNDEIIIGTEKKSMIEKFVLGSVAQHIIINAHCPVVIV